MLFNQQNVTLGKHLENLESHLREEHPDLLHILPTYRQMDKVLYRLGLLAEDESLATRITWWPLISVLGTFSSGKSTFINTMLGENLQRTGNQAVDDKFTVLSYSHHDASRTLPGTALNNDPRFPFFRIGAEIEKVAPGEGRRIDTYLQLKTTGAQHLKGRTLIDSPGFDADDQRRSILRLTDHIIDISDLVLIFFDARHPEPGAMQDTLDHLVSKASVRADSNKFLYVLNQIDVTAREDNPEEVVAAWQRALAQSGLTGGRFLCIYNDGAAMPIENAALRDRYQRKRDTDMAEINQRMSEVKIERGYRIVGTLEDTARRVTADVIPALETALAKWRKFTLVGDAVGAAGAVGLAYGAVNYFGMNTLMGMFESVTSYVIDSIALAAGVGAVMLFWHYTMRSLASRLVHDGLPESFGDQELDLRRAFLKNTRPWRSVFGGAPAGWRNSTKALLAGVLGSIEGHIQHLNDQHTDPSGRKGAQVIAEPPVAQPSISEPSISETVPEAPTDEVPQSDARQSSVVASVHAPNAPSAD